MNILVEINILVENNILVDDFSVGSDDPERVEREDGDYEDYSYTDGDDAGVLVVCPRFAFFPAQPIRNQGINVI